VIPEKVHRSDRKIIAEPGTPDEQREPVAGCENSGRAPAHCSLFAKETCFTLMIFIRKLSRSKPKQFLPQNNFNKNNDVLTFLLFTADIVIEITFDQSPGLFAFRYFASA